MRKDVITQKVKSQNALGIMANRFKVQQDSLKKAILNSIKDTKLTEVEFVTFVVVANAYKLNPLTKEIFAFPDKKGGIIPIVSTDGWNKLMTTHTDYKSHSYVFSEKIVTLKGAKPCPDWMEIHIEKQDGGIIVVREYLDECYRELNFTSPWQTHTKRMLRHKTKIQGAREAFGFGGIYDKDEAERIIEGRVLDTDADEETFKIPQEIKPEKTLPEKKRNNYEERLYRFELAKKSIGDNKYYAILEAYGYKHANEIKDLKKADQILADMMMDTQMEVEK